jgi:membrane protein implicated in regulation of membrane protease activity
MHWLAVAGVALVAAELGLTAYGHRYLALVLDACAAGCILAYGILSHSAPLIGVAGVLVVLILVAFWRGPKRRDRVRKELGDESRQLRDGLVRRMRARRVTRRRAAPQPSC